MLAQERCALAHSGGGLVTPVVLELTATRSAAAQLLFFFFFNGDGFEIFSFEDLAAIQAFDIIHAVASCENLGAGVLARGLHKAIWDYSNGGKVLVKGFFIGLGPLLHNPFRLSGGLKS